MQNTRAVVLTEHGRSEKFNINTGLSQGDALSTLLFNLVLQSIVRKLDTRGNISTKLAQLCAYADDLVIITRTPNALKQMFLTLENEARYAGLMVNQSKTKYMKTVRRKDKITQQYITGQSQFENVNEFTYFGVQINSQNKISDEIRKRIQAGNRCYYANKKLLSNKILNYNSKIQTYKTIIRPTVTYRSETWVLTASDENQLNIFERKILRKIYGPTQNPDGSWRIKTNEELRHKMKQENIVKFIK
jgi:hypothetical protein